MDSEERPHIGIVTGSSVPGLTADGQAIEQALTGRGYEVSEVVWSASGVDWSAFDVLVVRSCWEYYQQPEKFRVWLDAIDGTVRHVINPVRVMEWNMHKSYLQELTERDITVTPTVCVEKGTSESLANICERENWDHVVVKPAIGTSSDGVWQATVPVSTDANERFPAAVAERDLLVQQFLPEVASGELSMIFFAGEYSHASRTVPETSGFRAHHSFGAASKSVTPSETVRETGRRILETASRIHNSDPADLTYARVDGVERDGRFVLLELELIEPYLSLSTVDGAVERFADAIEHAISNQVVTGGQT